MTRNDGWIRRMAFAFMGAVVMFTGCSQSTMGEKKMMMDKEMGEKKMMDKDMGEKKMMDKEMGKEEMMKDGGTEKKQ